MATEDVITLEDDSDCTDLIETISDELSELATTILEAEKDMDVTDDFSAIMEKLQTVGEYLIAQGYIES
jgi:hypothetical protein